MSIMRVSEIEKRQPRRRRRWRATDDDGGRVAKEDSPSTGAISPGPIRQGAIGNKVAAKVGSWPSGPVHPPGSGSCCCCRPVWRAWARTSGCGSIDGTDRLRHEPILQLLQDLVAQDRQCPTSFESARKSGWDRCDPASCWTLFRFQGGTAGSNRPGRRLPPRHRRRHRRKLSSSPEVPSSSSSELCWATDSAAGWSARESRK